MHWTSETRERLAAALDFAVFVSIVLICCAGAVLILALSKAALLSAMFLLLAIAPLLVWGWVLSQLRRYLEGAAPLASRERQVLRELRPDTVKPRGRAA